MKKIITSLVLVLVTLLSVQTLKAESVNGQILYQNDPNRPINDVKVALKNLDNGTIQSYITGGNGYYEFLNVTDGNYSLTCTKTQAGGGVTFYDATLVFLNIIGFYQFTPIQFLGADVNGSNAITWSDYNMIISHILYNTAFPIGPWTFESQYFTISNLKDGVPKGSGGTCSGDIGGTFVPTVNNTPALPVAQEGVINVSNSEPFTTRILTHNDLSITGAGILINYPEELMNIESIEFKGANFQYNIENGQIRVVWGDPTTEPINFNDGETFITLHGTSTEAFKHGMTAILSLDGNTSLMNTSNQEVSELSFASPVLKYNSPSLKLSNYPNPFVLSTKLSIYTPETGIAIIEVYSATGQLVKNITPGKMNAGYNEVSLDASQLAKGYYMCKLRIQADSGELSNTIRILKAE